MRLGKDKKQLLSLPRPLSFFSHDITFKSYTFYLKKKHNIIKSYIYTISYKEGKNTILMTLSIFKETKYKICYQNNLGRDLQFL